MILNHQQSIFNHCRK